MFYFLTAFCRLLGGRIFGTSNHLVCFSFLETTGRNSSSHMNSITLLTTRKEHFWTCVHKVENGVIEVLGYLDMENKPPQCNRKHFFCHHSPSKIQNRGVERSCCTDHSIMMRRHFFPWCMFSYRLRIRTMWGPPETLQCSSTSRLALGVSYRIFSTSQTHTD